MWALDLGTTNSILGQWNARERLPELLSMPGIVRRASVGGHLDSPRAVPSAVHILEEPGFLAQRLGWGPLAHIGRPAVELNALRPRPPFVPTFKRALSMSPLMPMARTGSRSWPAREVARLYVRELLREAKRTSGQRIRDLVVTVPVEVFETYRAELSSMLSSLGVRRVRFIDEPVAAALGYGLGAAGRRNVLVVDFGGGTFHVALVRLAPASVQEGRCAVLAKSGRDLGGNLVDRWLLEELCARLELTPPRAAGPDELSWERLLLADACRVKEAVYFKDSAIFEPSLPEDRRRFEARLRGAPTQVTFTRADLETLLEKRGLFRELASCIDEVLAQGASAGCGEDEIDDVLLVGGSSLLPGVYLAIESRFGRGRVRAWQPFEAIANGGCVFAGGEIEPADHIVHDYALLTFDARTNEPQHTVIVPRGTRFPTRPDLWKRRFVPTCALGEPERTFKLVICEIGSSVRDRTFAWDAEGRVHERAAGDAPIVVKLNESNPALGTLDPPHSPRDQSARLEIAFGVNADRWLCATVLDLLNGKHLMKDEPVVRLL